MLPVLKYKAGQPIFPVSPHIIIIIMEINENTDVLVEHPNEDHTWVTGGDVTIVHKRLIDEGAYGEVHHVSSIASLANHEVD